MPRRVGVGVSLPGANADADASRQIKWIILSLMVVDCSVGSFADRALVEGTVR